MHTEVNRLHVGCAGSNNDLAAINAMRFLLQQLQLAGKVKALHHMVKCLETCYGLLLQKFGEHVATE